MWTIMPLPLNSRINEMDAFSWMKRELCGFVDCRINAAGTFTHTGRSKWKWMRGVASTPIHCLHFCRPGLCCVSFWCFRRHAQTPILMSLWVDTNSHNRWLFVHLSTYMHAHRRQVALFGYGSQEQMQRSAFDSPAAVGSCAPGLIHFRGGNMI